MTISVITPSYGQLDWLRLCVASVADQVGTKSRGLRSGDGEVAGSLDPQSILPDPSQPPLEVEHIIQDGGTPGIEDFARELGADLKSKYGGTFVSDLQAFELLHLCTASGYTLRVFKEPDSGMYDAINKGISKIRGKIWAWLNSDEQYLPGTLEYVAEWFGKHPRTEILCGDALLIDGKGEALSYRRIVRPLWTHTRLVHLSSLSCASFYSRSIVEKVGCFDTTWRSIGDAEWMARMLKAGVRVRACGKLLSTFAFTGKNTSESPLARKESTQWKLAKEAPHGGLVKPVILIHRLRKMIAGAYRRRMVEYLIHAHGSPARVSKIARRLGWDWPGEGGYASAPDMPEKIPVLGTRVSVTDYDALSTRLIQMIRNAARPVAVDFANTQIVTMRRHDPVFARLTKCIDMVLPDGMPLVWVMNAKGAGLKDRVYGPTFTRRFLASCPQGMTHYLVGGSEECGRRFRERMKSLNQSLEFVGGYHGHCSSDGVLEDDDKVLSDIKARRPDFIWVGLGTPKQYEWIARIKPLLEHGILLAVGFAFDVNAGMKPDAPDWMQRCGLTWIYRMCSEPKRLAGRYLRWNSLFIGYSAWDALKHGDRS